MNKEDKQHMKIMNRFHNKIYDNIEDTGAFFEKVRKRLEINLYEKALMAEYIINQQDS